MLDTVITGGRVVTPSGAGDWDVGIIGEKIVVVALPGVLSAEGGGPVDEGGIPLDWRHVDMGPRKNVRPGASSSAPL